MVSTACYAFSLTCSAQQIKDWIEHLREIKIKINEKETGVNPTYVFGLGPGGLASALRLVEEGHRIRAYEKRSGYTRKYQVDLIPSIAAEYMFPSTAMKHQVKTDRPKDARDMIQTLLHFGFEHLLDKDLFKAHIVGNKWRMMISDLEKFLSLCLHLIADSDSFNWILYGTKPQPATDTKSPSATDAFTPPADHNSIIAFQNEGRQLCGKKTPDTMKTHEASSTKSDEGAGEYNQGTGLLEVPEARLYQLAVTVMSTGGTHVTPQDCGISGGAGGTYTKTQYPDKTNPNG